MTDVKSPINLFISLLNGYLLKTVKLIVKLCSEDQVLSIVA